MLRFRAAPPQPTSTSATDLLAVSQTIDDAMQPGNFFVAPDLALSWTAARAETIAWEIFRGRLLDPAHTRASRAFLSWHVVQLFPLSRYSGRGAGGEGSGLTPHPSPMSTRERGEGPLLSVKLDVHARQIHVTRGILCHVWEGYDSGSGVIDSREAVKWTHELVGTIALDECADVRDELICLLWQAVVGTSRLPLTSLEAPLPAFVCGELHYLYRPGEGETRTTGWQRWLLRGMHAEGAWRETVKLVEFALRHIKVTDAPALCTLPLKASEWSRLLRAMFNDVSLSPYTGFVDNALALIEALGLHDMLGHLLCKLGQHLTAYDLVTFHHRGANYPDALLLDAVLKAYLRHLEERPDWFLGNDTTARLRRRALRQGVLLRRHYEGHPVPDAPTSPGENARVMPAVPRVPDEQLTHVLRRRRKLFSDDPLTGLLTERARGIFAMSIRDLDNDEECRELGIGVFIDRPLGYAKEIGEPDQTPLLAHEAYSPSLARRRLRELAALDPEAHDLAAELAPRGASSAAKYGLSHTELADCPRPVAALADVRRVADDFVILRTLPVGLAACLRHFDWRPLLAGYRLRFLADGAVRWCVQAAGGILLLADLEGQRRLEMRVDVSQGYVTRAGVELPRAGLQVVTLWEDAGDGLTRHDLTAASLSVELMHEPRTVRA